MITCVELDIHYTECKQEKCLIIYYFPKTMKDFLRIRWITYTNFLKNMHKKLMKHIYFPSPI